MNIHLYTDGAYSSSRSKIGIGIVIVNADTDEIIKQYSKGYENGTNNKAEIAAVIVGLRLITEPCDSITIKTDSMLVIGWLSKNWKRNKNISLLKEADKQLKRVKGICPNVIFEHVKGHNGEKYNEICDKLAVKASQLI